MRLNALLTDIKIPDWFTFVSKNPAWAEGCTLRMRADFKANATLAQGRNMPHLVQLLQWAEAQKDGFRRRVGVDLEVVEGNNHYSKGEILRLSLSWAELAYVRVLGAFEAPDL